MSTSLIIKVNKEIFDKYQAICDARRLVSSVEITRNFIDGIIIRLATGIIDSNLMGEESNNYIEHFSQLGEDCNGNYEIEQIYLPSGYRYEIMTKFVNFINSDDKDKDVNFFRGCVVHEITTQYKRYCSKQHRRWY